MFSLGAHITYHLSQECTHVLVDQLMPVKEDMLDAIVAKKPFVLGSWVEVGHSLRSCIAFVGWMIVLEVIELYFFWFLWLVYCDTWALLWTGKTCFTFFFGSKDLFCLKVGVLGLYASSNFHQLSYLWCLLKFKLKWWKMVEDIIKVKPRIIYN